MKKMEEKNSIFISYSHHDSETVESIINLIKKTTDKEVWHDARLKGGENYFSVIAEQILKCTFFVFVVSNESIYSEFCLKELEFAASEKKTIVAIWLDDINISPRVKLVIQNTHYVEYYSMTDEKFSRAIDLAFNREFKGTERYDSDELFLDRKWSGKQYFLNENEIKQIEKLLQAENGGKYSFCFIPENANLLGIAYELGINVDVDLKKAEFYYRVSDYYQNYDGKYLYGTLRQKQDVDNPVWLDYRVEAAEHDSIFALTYLGDDLYYGRNGCEKDREKAYRFWRKAADLGSAAAMYFLAYGYRWGECVEKDLQLCLMYALKSSELGFPRAYRILAFMYESGEFFTQNYDSAIKMYDEAIKRGDYLCLCYKGGIYGEWGDYSTKKELYEQAEKMADKGLINSGTPYYRMGFIYEYGEGVERNYQTASDYYLKGAARKHDNSMKYAVPCIMEIQDDEVRKEYLLKALEFDCCDAAYYLGEEECIRNKENIRLSEKALGYYIRGAEQGDMACVVRILRNYSWIIGHGENEKDRVEAIRWFQFLFANADEAFLNSCRERDLLTTYYYAYAIELDFDSDISISDRELVRFYFVKALQESSKHLPSISSFIVEGYLFPEENDSGLAVDVEHAEQMLKIIMDYLDSYYKYIKEKEPDDWLSQWQQVMTLLKKGFSKISECYMKGKYVAKDKVKGKEYSNLILHINHLALEPSEENLQTNK